MANPSTVGVGDYKPAILQAETTESSVTLNPNKLYEIWHMGTDEAGNAQTDLIYLSTSASVDADASNDEDKLKLEDGHPFPVRISGWGTLYFESAENDPTFQIVPVQHVGLI